MAIFQKDYFNDSSLDPIWTESYQAGGSSNESGEVLTITSGDNYAFGSIFNASGVYQTITGDFDIKAKLNSVSGNALFVGLAWYINGNNHGGLISNDGYWFYDDGSYSSASPLNVTPPRYYRIRRVSTTITVYYSSNGTNWTAAISHTGGGWDAACRIWLVSNDNGYAGFTAEYDAIVNYADSWTAPVSLITLVPSGSISPSGDNVGNNPSNDTFTVTNSGGDVDSILNWTAAASKIIGPFEGYWLGCAAEPVVGNGSSVANYSYIYNEVCPIAGKITKIEIYVSNESAGVLDFAIFNDNGSNSYTDEHTELALPISNGLNQYYDGIDFNKDNLPIEINQYIGVYLTSSGIWSKITSNGPGYKFDQYDQISGTPAASNFTTSPNNTHEFQIRVWVEYPTFIDSDTSFITLTPSSGIDAQDGGGDLVTVSYDTQGLDRGLFNDIITVSDSNATNTPQTIDVNLTVYGSGNEDYIRYNAGTQETTNHIWIDIANAWDDDFNTNAEGIIYISGVTRTLVGTVHDNVRSDGRITKVEIGLHGSHLNSDSPNSFYARFDGSTDSASYYSDVTNSNTYHWYDITSDANGPGFESWTWTDIDNLDVYYIGGFDDPSPDEHYITQFYIRVAYNFAADESDTIEKINGVINFSRVNEVLISSLSKVNGVTVWQ